jgi:hypothetical protein
VDDDRPAETGDMAGTGLAGRTRRSIVRPCGVFSAKTAREFDPRHTRFMLFQPKPKCRWTHTWRPACVRSDVTFALKVRPLRPKPTRGATSTATMAAASAAIGSMSSRFISTAVLECLGPPRRVRSHARRRLFSPFPSGSLAAPTPVRL